MATKKQVRSSARKVVKTANRYATANEGAGMVARAAKKGQLRGFVVRDYRKQVRKELGAKSARQAVRALKTIDNSPAKAGVARRTANRVANKLEPRAMHKGGMGSYKG